MPGPKNVHRPEKRLKEPYRTTLCVEPSAMARFAVCHAANEPLIHILLVC